MSKTLPGNSSVESIPYMTEEEFCKTDYRSLPLFPTLLEVELGFAHPYHDKHDYYMVYLRHVYQSRKKRSLNQDKNE